MKRTRKVLFEEDNPAINEFLKLILNEFGDDLIEIVDIKQSFKHIKDKAISLKLGSIRVVIGRTDGYRGNYNWEDQYFIFYCFNVVCFVLKIKEDKEFKKIATKIALMLYFEYYIPNSYIYSRLPIYEPYRDEQNNYCIRFINNLKK